MRTIKIGRSTSCDYVIKDNVVSSVHAVITISDNGQITIEDLNSKNGTFVDGVRIQKKVLSPSSTVVLANHSIDWKQIIHMPGKSPQPTPPKMSVNIPTNVIEKKLIGRNLSAQLRFSFDDVSDKHAYLCKCGDGSVMIIDNYSTNGTYVNGVKITTPFVLKKGDVVLLSNRHPLNWETVYPLGRQLNSKWIGVAVAAVACIFLFFVSRPGSWFDKDWSDIYAQHKKDIVLVYVKSAYAVTVNGAPLSKFIEGEGSLDFMYFDSEGKIQSGITVGSGTGFFIDKEGRFLTNRHVVQGSGDIEKNKETIKRSIQGALVENNMRKIAANLEVNFHILSVSVAQNDTYVQTEKDMIQCSVLKVSDNKDLDVAILQTNTKSIPNGSTYVDLSRAVESKELSIGDRICTIGFPKSFTIGLTSSGLEANNQSGEITQERGAYQYGHNITVHQGASGSPVYDRKGRFAGIIVSGFLGLSQGYNHAIHPTPVIEFVKDNK